MKMGNGGSAWAELPVELWGLIFAKLELDASSLLSVALSNKKVYSALEQTINVSEEQKKCWDLEFLGKPKLERELFTYLRRLHQDARISELITRAVETGEGLEVLVEYVAEIGDESIPQLLLEQNSPYELLIRSAYRKQRFKFSNEDSRRFRVLQMGKLTRATIAERLLKILRYKKLADTMVDISTHIDSVSGPEYILKSCLVDPNYFQLMRQRHLVLTETVGNYNDRVCLEPGRFVTKVGLMVKALGDRLEHPLTDVGLGSWRSFLFSYDQSVYSVFSMDGFEWLIVCYDLFLHFGLECTMHEGYLTVSDGSETCKVDEYGQTSELQVSSDKLSVALFFDAGYDREMFKDWTHDDLTGLQLPSNDMKNFLYPHSDGGSQWILKKFAPHIEKAYPHYIAVLFEDFERYTRKGFAGTYDELFFGSFGDKSLMVSNGTFQTGRLVFCEEFTRIPQVAPVVYSTWDVEEFDGASVCSYYWMRGRYVCETPVIESSLTPYEPEKWLENYDKFDDPNILNFSCNYLTGKFFECFNWDNMSFVPNKFLLKWIKNHS